METLEPLEHAEKLVLRARRHLRDMTLNGSIWRFLKMMVHEIDNSFDMGNRAYLVTHTPRKFSVSELQIRLKGHAEWTIPETAPWDLRSLKKQSAKGKLPCA